MQPPPVSTPKEPRLLDRLLWIGACLAVAVVGALIWQWLHFPLPWLVGSLYAVALARIAGLPLAQLPYARQGGQWVIGTNMGLYFTAGFVLLLEQHLGLIVGMAVFSLFMGILGAGILVRSRLADPATAFFSALPGGASEMANIADFWNAAVDRVAAAHATRVMVVVLVIPMVITFAGMHGTDASTTLRHPVAMQYLPWMALAGLAGSGLFILVGLPNPWILGSMAITAALSIAGVPLSGLPAWLTDCGQVFIGISLGCRFGPGFLKRAPAFLGAIAAMSVVFLALMAMAAYICSQATLLSLGSLLLSFSPGGIAEMSLTASQLQLGVPLVVASHVVRVIILSLSASPAYRVFARLHPQKQA
jgi:membrane AbrB-like protein